MEPTGVLLEWETIVGLALLGLAVGFLAGLFGVGGGFLLTPALHLAFRIPYELAVGSALVQLGVTGALGAWRHARSGYVDAPLGAALLLGSLPGAEAGVRLQRLLRTLPELRAAGRSAPGFDVLMDLAFIGMLLAVGSWMWSETGRLLREGRAAQALPDGAGGGHEGGGRGGGAPRPGEEPPPSALSERLARLGWKPMLALAADPRRRLSLWVPVGLGFVMGVLTGVLGTGGGFVMMPALVYLLGLPTGAAVGTSSLTTAATALYGSARYVAAGEVLAGIVAATLAGSLAGVWAGARASHRWSKLRLRRSFAAVVFIAAALLALDLARLLAG